MEQYRICIKKSVSKDFKKIPTKDVQRILDAIQGLAKEPRPLQSKKLSGQERYRLRQGDYRILYSIEDEELIIYLVKVGNRRDVCK